MSPVNRRTERLLTSGDDNTASPLTTGLLLLELMRLREYAEKSLPRHSKLKEGLLEDVEDLEDPALTKEMKAKVVERMWRCWGDELGWRA
jgi:nuclear control of ATPase protein 2